MRERGFRLQYFARRSAEAILWLAAVSWLLNGALLTAQTWSEEGARARLAQLGHPFRADDPNNDPATISSFANAAGAGRLDLVRLYVAAGIDLNAPDQRAPLRSTALLKAITGFQAETAFYLLAQGADPNLANSDGVAPLSLAIRSALNHYAGEFRPQYPELFLDLLARGAAIESRDKNGFTPLMEAARVGYTGAVKILHARGANINARAHAGETALLLAAGNYPPVAAVLLELGADPNAATEQGRAPLMEAVQRGWLEAGEPALMEGYAELIQLLLDKGANANAQDADGTTALMEAATNGDAGTLRLLLARGADPDLRNAQGETALDLAAKNRRGDAVRALIEHGSRLTTKQRLKYYAARFAYGLAWIFPLFILASAPALYFYSRRELKKPVEEKHDLGGDDLPRLAPLKCAACGGGLPLKAGEIRCPYCAAPGRPPKHYRETLAARAAAEEALQRAVIKWRHASWLTAAPVRWFLFLVALLWLVGAGVGAFNEIGLSLFDGHWFLFISALLGLAGVPLSALLFADYLAKVRERLPKIPEIGESIGEDEIANCFSCGATVAYAAGQLATTCGYCGGEIYRVALARRARQKATQEKEKASLSLYNAMVEVAELRREFLEHLLTAPLYLPVLLYLAPVTTILIIILLGLLGSC